MDSPPLRPVSTSTRFLLGLASFVLIVAGMYVAQELLVQVLLAMFIAAITAPLYLVLRRRLPTWAVLLIMVLLLACLLTAVGVVIGGSLRSLGENLAKYRAGLAGRYGALSDWLAGRGIDLRQEVRGFLGHLGDGTRVVDMIQLVLRQFTDLLGKGFVVFLLVVFLWLEVDMLPGKVRAVVRRESFGELGTAVDRVRRYMVLKTWLSLGTGVLVWLWCLVLGVDYALLLGFLAFVLNFVPVIGSIIAALPGVLLAYIEHDWGVALATAGGYLVVNVVIGNVIEPRVLGHGLGISPLVVMLSLLFWGFVLGPVGMFLSLPLTVMVKVALESDEDTRWIAILLAGGAPTEGTDGTPGDAGDGGSADG